LISLHGRINGIVTPYDVDVVDDDIVWNCWNPSNSEIIMVDDGVWILHHIRLKRLALLDVLAQFIAVSSSWINYYYCF
jgi:hypothetical protein